MSYYNNSNNSHGQREQTSIVGLIIMALFCLLLLLVVFNIDLAVRYFSRLKTCTSFVEFFGILWNFLVALVQNSIA